MQATASARITANAIHLLFIIFLSFWGVGFRVWLWTVCDGVVTINEREESRERERISPSQGVWAFGEARFRRRLHVCVARERFLKQLIGRWSVSNIQT